MSEAIRYYADNIYSFRLGILTASKPHNKVMVNSIDSEYKWNLF